MGLKNCHTAGNFCQYMCSSSAMAFQIVNLAHVVTYVICTGGISLPWSKELLTMSLLVDMNKNSWDLLQIRVNLWEILFVIRDIIVAMNDNFLEPACVVWSVGLTDGIFRSQCTILCKKIPDRKRSILLESSWEIARMLRVDSFPAWKGTTCLQSWRFAWFMNIPWNLKNLLTFSVNKMEQSHACPKNKWMLNSILPTSIPNYNTTMLHYNK